MKNFAFTTAILTLLAIPTASFAQDMFPNLTYPDTWETKANTDTVAMPFVPLLPADE